MTPAVVQLMQRLADGETVACYDEQEPGLSIYIRADGHGSLEFRPVKSYEPTWHDAGYFNISSLVTMSRNMLPPEPEQPKRQVRSVDLSE